MYSSFDSGRPLSRQCVIPAATLSLGTRAQRTRKAAKNGLNAGALLRALVTTHCLDSWIPGAGMNWPKT